MKISIIAFSRRGCELGQKICTSLSGHECRLYSKTSADVTGIEKVDGSASKWTQESFKTSDAIVYIGAAGIAVRYIAPFVKCKTADPAVISADETGQFVISLLSGHIGGANDLAKEIAEKIGAVPVITTATDIHGRFSVDSYAVKHNLHIGSMALAKDVSSLIINDGKVGLASDIPIIGRVPPELSLYGNEGLGIFVSYRRSKGPFERTLKLTPRCHVLGIGCRSGTPAEDIETLVNEVLGGLDISLESIKAVASVDLKREEAGLLEYSKKIGTEPIFFSSEELSSLPDMGFTPSEFVRSVTGVDNVCERAAYAASEGGEILVRKTSGNGVTLAVVRDASSLDFREE